jgi:hypothetical protein
MPMLPDTLGTGAFLKAAEACMIHPMKDGVPQTHLQCSLLEVINSARQDSGRLEQFKSTLQKYPLFKGGMMASEIGSNADLEAASKLGYPTFGAGGYFGDSESVWPVTKDKKCFSLSMAVKAVRVSVNGKRTAIQPVKIGDDEEGGKITCDSTLSKEEKIAVIERGQRIKQAALAQPHSKQIMSVDEGFEASFEKMSDSSKKSRA